MKALKFVMMLILFAWVFQSPQAIAGEVYGSSAIVNDVANNTVRGYSRTELDYETATYYTPYVCGELFKDGVSQVRACQGGLMTASRNTTFTGTSATSSLLSDHYVDMQYFDEGQQSYTDYSGYSFLPGYTYPLDWLFNATNIFTYHNPVSIRLGSTDVSCNCSCTTRPNDTEWGLLHGWFPNMVRCETCKLAGESTTYNCLAWTIDDTTRWWWEEADTNTDNFISVTEMNAFLNSKGKSNIAYYGSSTSNVKHVAKKAGGNGNCLATSKVGSYIRISHNLNQMEGGSTYGNIVGGN